MTAPFRSEEGSALVRVGQLEAENAELVKEIETLRASVGENRNVYVKHLEDQIADLKRENAHLETRAREAGLFVASRARNVEAMRVAIAQVSSKTVQAYAAVAIVAALVGGIVVLLVTR